MDWKKQFDIHKESSGIIIICVILLIAVLVDFLFTPICSKSAAHSRRCISNLNVIPKYMYYTAEEMEPEDLAKMTVADLLQESIRKWKMKEDQVVCPIDGRPYDIFPLSAAEFVRGFESGDHPVPVVMCRGTHVKDVRGWSGWYKTYYGTPVVYMDGLRELSREEAEKLVSELSPEPIEFPIIQTDGPDGLSSGHPSDSTP